MVTILGIETSCDETAISVIQDHVNPKERILSNCIASQINEHQPYGGVVPEIAARSHLLTIQEIFQKALKESKKLPHEINGVAVTAGPGLLGGVLVGLMFAKSITMALKKPFLAINHLEAHALTPRLTHNVPFPYLLLLISGGHCQFLEVLDLGAYRLLGETLDDAPGEVFDKVAGCLGLPYPGGPSIEKLALAGNASAITFPIPLKNTEACDLSFSGLKTAVRTKIQSFSSLTYQEKADIAASFQQTVALALSLKLRKAIRKSSVPIKRFVVAGGVAANKIIRFHLEKTAGEFNLEFIAPPIALCTDNGAMVAWAGIERYKKGLLNTLDFPIKPRWPLDQLNSKN